MSFLCRVGLHRWVGKGEWYLKESSYLVREWHCKGCRTIKRIYTFMEYPPEWYVLDSEKEAEKSEGREA